MSSRSRSRARGSTPGRERDVGSSGPILELLVVFVLVYLVQGLTSVAGVMGGLFVLAPPLTTNPWTIVTSVYAHSGVGHLVSNALALVVFGWPVARSTTRLRFHVFFAVTGAIAGVSQIALTRTLDAVPLVPIAATSGVLGASGAVFALLGYLVASNRLSTGLASVVDLPRWLSTVAFVGLAVAVTYATAAPGAALIAHFAGFLLGLAAGRARVLAVGSRVAPDRTAT